MILLLSVGADHLQIGKEIGFGSYQQLGVAIGIVLLILGAVAQAGTIIAIGAAAVALSILADWIGFGNSPGFGAQQWTGTIFGLALLAAAFRMSRPTRI